MTTATGSRSELMAAIRGLSAARDLPPEVIIEALKAALVSAYHKIPGGEATNVTVELDEATGESRVYAHFTVVDEKYIEDPDGEYSVEQARLHDPNAVIGDTITLDVTPDDFGRIAAQTAKQVILQRIREAEREQTYTTYADREGEIVYGTIQTANRDSVTVALDRVEALLPKVGQIPTERYMPNQRIRVYVSEVKRSPKGPQVIVSRTHREMLRRLMELEIPEIFQGAVEIKAIAREAGSRSKVAVWAHQDGVDPVGACVGMRGVRIQALVRELGGEKIDIVEWDPDPRVFIAHALSPAKVVHVWLEEDTERRTANVVVPDGQLSLAIGREGQNARLAAKLTGWRIDIRAESEAGDVMEELKAEETARVAKRAKQEALAAEAAAAEAAAAEAAAEVAVEDAVAVGEPEDVTIPSDAVEPDVTTMPLAAEDEPAPEAAAPDLDEAEEPEVAPEDVPDALPQVPVVPEAEPEPAPTPPAEQPETPTTAPTRPPERAGGDADDELLKPQQPQRKKRRLVRDPKTGQLIAQTQRKRSRRRPDWEEGQGRWSGEDLTDSMGFTEEDFLGGTEDYEDVDAPEDEDTEADVDTTTDDGPEADADAPEDEETETDVDAPNDEDAETEVEPIDETTYVDGDADDDDAGDEGPPGAVEGLQTEGEASAEDPDREAPAPDGAEEEE
jgi:N utilization substance protein A